MLLLSPEDGRAYFFEIMTSIDNSTSCQNTDDNDDHHHHCENLKSHEIKVACDDQYTLFLLSCKN